MTHRLRLTSWLLAALALTPQGASARQPDPAAAGQDTSARQPDRAATARGAKARRPDRAAAALADPAATRAVDWRPVELTPVALAGGPAWAVEPIPEASPERTLDIGPDKAALVRVAPLAALLVRAAPDAPATLTFWRRTGAPGPGRAAVAEPGTLVSPGTWRIEQPPGSSGEWLIGADKPTKISVLTPTPRPGELIWEHVAGAVLAWIDRGGDFPALPEAPAMHALRRELLADAAVVAALRESDPKDMSLQKAAQAWRAAAALQRIAALRPRGRTAFALETAPRQLAGAGTVELGGRTYQRVGGDKTWELELHGPGVAWISARLLGQAPKARITVTAAGRRIARERLLAAAPCPPEVADCREEGPERRIAVPLAPGSHAYRIRLEGDGALLHIQAGRTLERFAAAVHPRSVAELVRAGRRALARSRSPRAGLVDALLASVDGRPLVATDRPAAPALALTRDWLRAHDDDLPRARRRELAGALVRAAASARDPHLAARARAAATMLVEETGDSALARRLLERPGTVTAAELAALAPLLDGPPLPLASPTLAALEHARRGAPHDPDLRAAYREHWRATRWSALHADAPGAEALQWIDRAPPDPVRIAPAASLWTWPKGQAQTVTATALPAAPRRPALLRLYAHGDAGVTVTVDGHAWQTLPLTRVEPIELALPAGPHELEIDAPAGVDVWSSQPPTPSRPPDARLLRLWPATPDRAVRFPLAGEPAFVRVDVRALDAAAPARVNLSVKTDTGLRRELAVELAPADDDAVPLAGGPRLGPATSVLVPLDLRARSLEVRVAPGGPRVAVSASVRAPGREGPAPVEPAADLQEHVRKDTSDDPLAVVAQASRALLDRPDDPDLLLARADALLDLDQRAYALSDWARLTARPLPPRLHPRARALGARIEALGAPSHIDISTGVPVLVAPALAAADIDPAALARLAPIAARAREGGPAAALAALEAMDVPSDMSQQSPIDLTAVPGETAPLGGAGAPARDKTRAPARQLPAIDPAEEAMRAALLDAVGRPGEAFRAWHRAYAATGRWQFGLAGIKSALLAFDPPTPAPAKKHAPKDSHKSRPALDHVAWDMSGKTDANAPEDDKHSLVGSVSKKTDDNVPEDTKPHTDKRSSFESMSKKTASNVPEDTPPGNAAASIKRSPVEHGAALAYGLALRVRPEVRTPALARLTALAGERSRWSHLILSELGSSRELVSLPLAPAPASVSADVRAALLAPPFPTDQALVLKPGVPVLFDLARGHRDLAFDLWCRQIRPELGGASPTVRFWMGEELLHTADVPAATAAEARFTVPARDAVTLALDETSHGWLCAARLRRPEARTTPKAARWHVARAGRPVEFVVLGPTTVQIEVHGRPASDIKIALARGDGPFGAARPLVPANSHAPSGMSQETPDTSPPTQVLTLADDGPLRMRLAPGVGSARIRVHQRLDSEVREAPPRPPRRTGRLVQPALPEAPGDTPAADTIAPAVPPPDARRVQRFGTPYAEFHVGTDDLEDSDDLRPRVSGVIRLGYARELLARRLWLEVNPELRPREDTALTAGGRLTLQAFFPRAGLRAYLSGLGLVQTEQPSAPWSLRVEGRLDRPTWLAPRLQLLPGLDLAYRHQSLNPGHGFPPGELHPRVYQWYVEDHPLVFRPTLDLRVAAWQDARVVVGADMMPNSDFRSVDQVSAHVGMAGALALHRRLVPEFALDYEASLRLRDDDRSKTYLRSRILAGLGLGIWVRDNVRIAFGVRNNLYLSAPFPARNALDLWLRIDLPLGRGLRDFGPLEMPFRAARERRLWRQEPMP